jgi:GrpB-like predicted nucleotidyltransferase (UPF0157 family)
MKTKIKSKMDVTRAPVEVFDHDPQWPKMFDREKTLILNALGNKVISIEHIGSTSVPGLGAKPIIDIMVSVRVLSDAKRCIRPLESIGYEYVPEYEDSIPERRYFRKGPNKPNKHYHLHMVEYDGELWKRYLLFRDYLRTHPQTASEYFKLKKRLAVKYRLNREGYTDAKASFVASVISKANSEKRQARA